MTQAAPQAAPSLVDDLNTLRERGARREDVLVEKLSVIVERVLDAVADEAARNFERTATPLVSAAQFGAPTPNEVMDVDAVVSKLRTKTDPVRMAHIDNMLGTAAKGAGIDWSASNPFSLKLHAQAGSQIVNIAETTQLNVMRIIRRSQEEGLTIPDTAKAIRAGMKEATPARARLIARTELAGATNGGALAAAQMVTGVTGEQVFKVWLTAEGAPNPRHEEYDGLDGQTVRLDEPFDVGGWQLQFPGDPDGPPEEVCNCRCTLSYTEDAAELSDAQGDGIDPLGLAMMPVEPPTPAADLYAPDGRTVEDLLTPGQWQEPPTPLGIHKGKGGAGGFTSDKMETTLTETGRIGERAFQKLTGGDIMHPVGLGEQSPLDVKLDGFGFEVKSNWQAATEFKATPKPFEVAQKEAAAQELGLRPALSITVLERTEQEGALRAHVYWREGLKGGRLSQKTGWNYMGSVDMSAEEVAAARMAQPGFELTLMDAAPPPRFSIRLVGEEEAKAALQTAERAEDSVAWRAIRGAISKKIDEGEAAQLRLLGDVNDVRGAAVYRVVPESPIRPKTIWVNVMGSVERGGGTRLMRGIAREVGPGGRIELAATPDSVGFYERLGFTEEGVGTMRLEGQPLRDLIAGADEPTLISDGPATYYLDALQDVWGSSAKLNLDQRQALATWKLETGYKAINGYLREGIDTGFRDLTGRGPAEFVKLLDEAIASAPPLDEGVETVVYRGVKDLRAVLGEDVRVGTVFKDAGYESVTTELGVAEDYTSFTPDSGILKIELPPGERGVWMRSTGLEERRSAYYDAMENKEMLLARDRTYQVVDVGRENGIPVVTLRPVEAPVLEARATPYDEIIPADLPPCPPEWLPLLPESARGPVSALTPKEADAQLRGVRKRLIALEKRKAEGSKIGPNLEEALRRRMSELRRRAEGLPEPGAPKPGPAPPTVGIPSPTPPTEFQPGPAPPRPMRGMMPSRNFQVETQLRPQVRGLFPQTGERLRDTAERAPRLLDRVLRTLNTDAKAAEEGVTPDEMRRKLQAKIVIRPLKSSTGANFDPMTNQICVNPRSASALRGGGGQHVFHEMGHYIDYAHLGDNPWMPATKLGRVDEVLSAAMDTPEYREVERLAEREVQRGLAEEGYYSAYATRPDEVFARAFSQYTVTKLRQPAVYDTLSVSDARMVDKAWEALSSGETDQWSVQSFKRIEKAFDDLFAKEGWLVEPEAVAAPAAPVIQAGQAVAEAADAWAAADMANATVGDLFQSVANGRVYRVAGKAGDTVILEDVQNGRTLLVTPTSEGRFNPQAVRPTGEGRFMPPSASPPGGELPFEGAQFPASEQGVRDWLATADEEPAWTSSRALNEDSTDAAAFEAKGYTADLPLDRNLIPMEGGHYDPSFDVPDPFAPINVVKWGDKYYVADGHHRVAWLMKNGYDAVEALVIDAAKYGVPPPP